MPDIPAENASRGYYWRAQFLSMLAPESTHRTIEVPVSMDINDRATENGICSYRVTLEQTRSALHSLQENNPDKIITLGGECSVSVVPFTYLAEKYPDDLAIVWIDVHPDVTLPYDEYQGYHAMALTACLGMGDKEIISLSREKSKHLILSW